MLWLIAEDESDILNLVVMMAEVWGHKAVAFENGQKAVDYLDKIANGQHDGPVPDFALMDIRMPGKRGDEVAKHIRSVEAVKKIPIVLMTAFVLSDDERHTMIEDTGVDKIINKPLPDFQQLRDLLHGVIEEKSKG